MWNRILRSVSFTPVGLMLPLRAGLEFSKSGYADSAECSGKDTYPGCDGSWELCTVGNGLSIISADLCQALNSRMVRLDLGSVVLRRMKEEDIEAVKALIKEGCEGTENRIILHLVTRPLALLLLATLSSVLRFVVHSFMVALFIPVFLLIVYLKLTIPRSMGILGSSRPCWDYLGSSYNAESEPDLRNPHGAKAKLVSGQDVKRRKKGKAKERNKEAGKGNADKEKPDRDDLKDRARVAGEVWVAECDGEMLGCVARDGWSQEGVYRVCRLVVQSWYRREGLGKLLVQSLEARAKQNGVFRVYAHVPFPSKVGEVFFRKLGYRLQGETDGVEEEEDYEEPEKGWLGFPVTKVFVKDL